MDILLVSATPFEMAPLLGCLHDAAGTPDEQGVYLLPPLRVKLLVTGVGMVSTAFHLGQLFATWRPHLALNMGIAGALDTRLQLGDVLCVGTERFADMGVEEADGRFTDLFAMHLQGPDNWPYQRGLLRCPPVEAARFLPVVHGLTVNRVHGTAASIAAVRARHPDAQVESMEGAAFFFASLLAELPFLQVRSISNYVEPRNRANWDIPLAIERLNETVWDMLQSLREG